MTAARRTSMAPQPLTGCPKHMAYGPCGGVGHDGACEVSPEPCVFLDGPTVLWDPASAPRTSGSPAGPTAHLDLLALARARPVVVSGLTSRALDPGSIVECADVLRGSVDAVLVGDSGRARVQLPPAYRAHLVQQAGLPAWVGVTCRDRNRVALEGELAALAHVGVAGVHCITGDHTDSGDRPDAAPVFDLESTELVALARACGLTVSVAESPASPPVDRRAARLAQKVRAGAQLCLPQYCGDVDDVRRFVEAAHTAGAAVPVLPGVPVVVDREGALVLASFASAVLPTGYVDGILAAADPFEAGVAAATRYAEALLAVEGVAGVVLAGGPAPGTELVLARALARVGASLGAGT